jgi:hypothetical protein
MTAAQTRKKPRKLLAASFIFVFVELNGIEPAAS